MVLAWRKAYERKIIQVQREHPHRNPKRHISPVNLLLWHENLYGDCLWLSVVSRLVAMVSDTCIHSYVHTYIYTYIHTYIHTYIDRYIDTCIHLIVVSWARVIANSLLRLALKSLYYKVMYSTLLKNIT